MRRLAHDHNYKPQMITDNPRPKRNDDAIIAVAAKLLAPAVKEWCENDTATLEWIERDLRDAMRWRCTDGYDLARALDTKGYQPDAALVEILDGAGHCEYKAHQAAEIEWLKTAGLTAPAIGAQVSFEQSGKTIEGEVTSNHPDGKATVCCPSLGHHKTIEGGKSGTLGQIIEWERLTILP